MFLPRSPVLKLRRPRLLFTRSTGSTASEAHWWNVERDGSKGHGLRHNPFNSIIAPRPIGWIGSQSKDGAVNLAPYSFFNAVNYHPPMIGFASIDFKDTVRNILETGEFTWNLASWPLAQSVNITCEPVDPDVDEFELAGLTKAASTLVAPPRVLESGVNFECRMTSCCQLKNKEGEHIDTWFVIGEVVGVHISKDLIVSGVYDTVQGEPIMRGGGPADYFRISRDNRFIMHRKHGHLEDPAPADLGSDGEVKPV